MTKMYFRKSNEGGEGRPRDAKEKARGAHRKPLAEVIL
jgi:hypothetical protein